MPIHEYQCKSCGTVFDFFTGVEKNKEVYCKNCESQDVKRLISAPSILSTTVKRDQGRTCCGRTERCETPPCSEEGTCGRD